MSNISELVILFATSLLAATIFPAQSEAVLVGLHATESHPPWLLLTVASIGNVLGSVINWLLGRYFIHFQDQKWFPLKGRALNKTKNMYQIYGVWTLLFAWVPFIGDPLTLVAGFFRTHIGLFLLLVAIGKVGRYALLLSLM